MAGQHWGERGDPNEPVSLGGRIAQWVFIGAGMLLFASQVRYIINLLTGW